MNVSCTAHVMQTQTAWILKCLSIVNVLTDILEMESHVLVSIL
jgi:hypothetical protein